MNDFANAVKGASESSTEQANMLKQRSSRNRADFQCRTEQPAAAEETSATSQSFPHSRKD